MEVGIKFTQGDVCDARCMCAHDIFIVVAGEPSLCKTFEQAGLQSA